MFIILLATITLGHVIYVIDVVKKKKGQSINNISLNL